MSTVSKRPSRVFAMQLLYAMELTSGTPGECLPGILQSQPIQDEMKKYGMSLVDLVLEHRKELNEVIDGLSHSWKIERMPILDKIIMEVALIELLHKNDVPVKVVIQEAVQIANKFSTDDSARFINGLLDVYAKSHQMFMDKKSREE
jgi:transcription antitermination protein NusB